MFAHKINEKVDAKTYFGWFLLSFLAGNINTGGFLCAHKFVSHVTGFATLSGISFAKGQFLETLGLLTVPFFFLAGVMFSGYLTEKQTNNSPHGQKFSPVMGVVAIILAIVTGLGTIGWFGEFGATGGLGHDYVLLALLCGSCGLQNAAITSASGATIRTTHLTGLTTDLGLGLIRAEVYHSSAEQRWNERLANYLRIMTIISFILGSAIGTFFYIRFQYLGFLFPTFIATCISLAKIWGKFGTKKE